MKKELEKPILEALTGSAAGKKRTATKRYLAIGLRLLAAVCCLACIIGSFGKVLQSNEARSHYRLQEAAEDAPAYSQDLFNELAGSGSESTMRDLLQRGADPTAHSSGSTPLILAVQKRDVDLCKLLLKYGADAEAQDKNNKTALDYARERNYSAIISLLKTHGATR